MINKKAEKLVHIADSYIYMNNQQKNIYPESHQSDLACRRIPRWRTDLQS